MNRIVHNRAYRDALLNEEYYRRLATRASTLEMVLRIVTAACSTGAVGAAVTKLGPDWALPLLAATAALASVYSLVARPGDVARRREELAGEWTSVAGELRELLEFGGADDAADTAKLRALTMRSEDLHKKDREPQRKGLVTELQADVNARFPT